MKLMLKSPGALLCALFLTGQASADNLTWDGGGADAAWTTGTNWVADPASPPTFGVDSIQTFNAVGAINLVTYLGAPTTIGTLNFNANADSDASLRLYSNGTGTGGSVSDLTFDVTADSAAINVDADATGNFTLGVGGGSILLSDNLVVTHNGTGNLTINRAITMTPTFNALKLTKEGPGTLTLSAVNTYNGGTTINGGTIKAGFGNIFNSGNGTPVVINSSGTLDANGRGILISTFSGSGTLDNSSATGNTIQIGLNGTGGTFSGLIKNSGGGPLSLWKWGAGTTILSGLNTHTGLTWCVGGTLSINSISSIAAPAPSALGQPVDAINAPIRFGSGAGAGSLRYTGPTVTTDRPVDLRGITGGGALNASGTGPITFTADLIATGAGSKTLTLNGTSTDANTFAGKIVDNSPTNKTSVFKNGTGTWVLTAANPYTGTTTASVGTLLVNGTHSVGDAYTVSAAGTLGGSGTISAAVAVSGTLAPGPGGPLSTGAVAFENGGTLAIDINTSTATADKLVVTGNVTRPGAAANLTLTDLGSNVALPLGTKFTVVQYSGTWDPSLTLQFNGVEAPNNSNIVHGANTYTVKYDDSLAMTLTTVPSSPYDTWMNSYFVQIPNGADRLPGADPDKDGASNLVEFALNGDPTNGADNGKQMTSTLDSTDAGTDPELTLTLAVRNGAVASPSPNNSINLTVDGIVYNIQGSLTLATPFDSPVSEVTPFTLSPAPQVGWTARTFRLDASDGLAGKGFLRVSVSR